MGRKTFESIGPPASERDNLVLTRDRAGRAGVMARALVGRSAHRAGCDELVAIGARSLCLVLRLRAASITHCMPSAARPTP